MSTPETLVLQAETLTQEGRLDEAVAAYAAALDLDEHHVPALIGAGHLALLLSMPAESSQFIERALEHAPGRPEALVVQGLLAEAKEGLAAGIVCFAKLAKDAPQFYEGHYHHGRTLAADGQLDEAIPPLEQAAVLGPAQGAPLYVLGHVHHKKGALDASALALAKAIARDPLYLDAHVTLADVLAEMGQLDAAQEALSVAATQLPNAAIVYSKQAALALKQGDLPRGVKALQAQVALTPEDVEVHVSLATMALMAGESKAFAAAVSELLALHPRDWRAQQLHATLMDMADRPEDAIAALRQAHQLAPKEWKPLNDLGDLLNAKAQVEPAAATEAVDVLTEACQLAPVEALEPRYNLALAYWNAGHKTRAQEAAAMLVKAGPADHPVVLQSKEVLAAMTAAGEA